MTKAPPNLKAETVVRRAPDQLSADLGGGETVLMSMGRGNYYGLGESGTRVWELLEAPISVDTLCDRLTDEYDVDRATCERDVTAYLRKLIEEDLVAIVDDEAG